MCSFSIRSVQLILGIRRHISKTVTSFSSHFFIFLINEYWIGEEDKGLRTARIILSLLSFYQFPYCWNRCPLFDTWANTVPVTLCVQLVSPARTCGTDILFFICFLFVCLFVRLLPVKVLKSFATWRHLAASGAFLIVFDTLVIRYMCYLKNSGTQSSSIVTGDIVFPATHSNRFALPYQLKVVLVARAFFSVQFYTKTAVLNGFLQF